MSGSEQPLDDKPTQFYGRREREKYFPLPLLENLNLCSVLQPHRVVVATREVCN
jgi:hypothetical protein